MADVSVPARTHSGCLNPALPQVWSPHTGRILSLLACGRGAETAALSLKLMTELAEEPDVGGALAQADGLSKVR